MACLPNLIHQFPIKCMCLILSDFRSYRLGSGKSALGFIMVCGAQVLNADFRLYDRLRPKRESTVMHLEVCQNIKLHSCALDIYNFQWEPVFQFDFMFFFTAN